MNMMNTRARLTALTATAALAAGSAHAATVQQFVSFSDGNSGGADTYSVGFDVVNANSILVATVYVDSGDASLVSATFGGVAADATVTDGRLTSLLFINPSTASGLDFDFDPNAGGAGAGAILYEVTGAETSLASITTATGSNTIDTTTADELIVSFAGRNNNTAASVNGSSIFSDEDVANVGAMKGGGSLASASAIAPSIGSQNISWNNASDGRVAYAFEVVPEPSSLALLSLGGLLIARRRRG